MMLNNFNCRYFQIVFWACFFCCNALADNAGGFIDKGINALNAKNYKLAIVNFTKSIQIDTNNAYAYYLRGLAYKKIAKTNMSLIDLDKSIEINPTASALMLKANVLYIEHNFSGAIDNYTKAIGLNSQMPELYENRANAYAEIHNYSNAVFDCNISIMLNPDRALAYELRAYIYTLKGATKEAIADYSQSLKFNPNNASALAARGLLFAKNGDYKMGIMDCENAARLDTNSAIANNNFAWLLAVVPDTSLRDGNKAIEYAKRACALGEWKEPHALGTLAAAYAEVSDFKNAIKWQKECLKSGLPEAEQDIAIKQLEQYKLKKPYRLNELDEPTIAPVVPKEK